MSRSPTTRSATPGATASTSRTLLQPDGSRPIWAEDISIHHNDCSAIGRMGIAVIAAKRVHIERNSFDRMSLDILDIEPDFAAPRRDPTCCSRTTRWAPTPTRPCTAATCCRSAGTPPRRLPTSPWTTTWSRAAAGSTSATPRAVSPLEPTAPTARNIRFTNNKLTTPGPGYMLDFENVSTLTVTGNVQPLTSGKLAYIINSTGVTYP